MTARSAAVRYAVANSWEIPAGKFVVAFEPSPGDSTFPRPAATRTESRDQDAREIARVIGPSVQATSARTLVRCAAIRCATTGETAVLFASDPEVTNAGTVVGINLYSSRQGAVDTERLVVTGVVAVERKGNGWVATGTTVGPHRVVIRSPPR